MSTEQCATWSLVSLGNFDKSSEIGHALEGEFSICKMFRSVVKSSRSGNCSHFANGNLSSRVQVQFEGQYSSIVELRCTRRSNRGAS